MYVLDISGFRRRSIRGQINKGVVFECQGVVYGNAWHFMGLYTHLRDWICMLSFGCFCMYIPNLPTFQITIFPYLSLSSTCPIAQIKDILPTVFKFLSKRYSFNGYNMHMLDYMEISFTLYIIKKSCIQ